METSRKPLTIIHLSDLHVGASWGPYEGLAGLRSAIAMITERGHGGAAVLLSGDLSHHGTDEEYSTVRELVGELGLPMFAMAGNRDDRAALRRHFDVGDTPDELRYVVDFERTRLVVLDSKVADASRGKLGSAQLEWLDARLAEAAESGAIVALHHPPIASASPLWDAKAGLDPASRAGLAEVLRAHGNVRRVVCGHLHRTFTGEIGGAPVLAVPSTYVQSQVFDDQSDVKKITEPAGYAVHTAVGEEIASEVFTFA